jgi:hypothetical protein
MTATQALNDLINIPADARPIVSLYVDVPVDPKDHQGMRSRVHSLLDQLAPPDRGREPGSRSPPVDP